MFGIMGNKCIWNVKEEDRLCRYCMLTHCADRAGLRYRAYGSIMPKMRAMEVGDELIFDFGAYGSCRTSASRLGRYFGVKIITRHEDDGIHVVRIL